MKILHYTVVLFVIFIGYVIASTSDYDTRFSSAVDKKMLSFASNLYGQSSSWDQYYDKAKYLVENASPASIIKIAERVKYRGPIIAALYTSGSEETRKEVFEKFSFSDGDLILASDGLEIACQPKHLLDLLGRMTRPLFKYAFIDNSIQGLFKKKRTKCIGPLLNALKDDKILQNAAILKVLKEGVYNNDEIWVKPYYNHPAVTSYDYAEILIWLVREKRVNDPIFEFLFKGADRDDLETLLSDKDYRKDAGLRNVVDQAIVEQTVHAAKPAGSRHSTWKEVTTGATEAAEPHEFIAEFFAEEVFEGVE